MVYSLRELFHMGRRPKGLGFVLGQPRRGIKMEALVFPIERVVSKADEWLRAAARRA